MPFAVLLPVALAVETASAPVDDPLLRSAVWSVTQDDAGWLWLGTAGGVVRWDGVAGRRWGGPAARDEVIEVVDARGDRVVALRRDRRLVELVGDGARDLPGPEGLPVEAAAPDGEGGVWAVAGGRLWRGPDPWVPLNAPPAQRVWRDGDGAWVAGPAALSRVDAAGRVAASLDVGGAISVSMGPSGGWAGTQAGEVWRWDGDGLRRVLDLDHEITRVIAVADGAWIATHFDLRRLRGDEVVATIDAPRGVLGWHQGVLRDREGSLWTGTAAGLWHLPDPETWTWTADDGLRTTTGVALAGDGVWLSTWWAPYRIAPSGRVREGAVAWSGPPCVDTAGRVWALAEPVEGALALARLDDDAVVVVDLAGRPRACAPARDGGLWISTSEGVGHRGVDGAWTPALPAEPPAHTLYEASDGDLVFGTRGQVCRAPPGGAARCEALPAMAWPHGYAEVDGALWIGGEALGVRRWTDAGVVPVAGTELLPSDSVTSLRPSPRGGVWVTTAGAVWRVTPGPEGGPWLVEEALDGSSGLPSASATALAEAPNGDVWLATAEGAVRVPTASRAVAPPDVTPVVREVRADGFVVEGPVALGWPRSALDVLLTAPSYRHRGRLLWRARSDPGAPWSTPTTSPVVRFEGLFIGQHAVQAQVSLDSGTWSTPSEAVAVRVSPPWPLRPPALMGLGTLIAAALWWMHRARVAAAVGVERERARIAMDLHDELGSGLGALSALSGLAAQDDLPDAARRAVAAQAASTAAELGDALADIVWTLRRDTGTLESLVRGLAERGRRLFADGGVRFEVVAPERLPGGQMSLAVYRAAWLVLIEALHNARKHAGASRVQLVVSAGAAWEVAVVDDGRGLEAPAALPGSGSGLTSMAARAASVGALLSVTSGEAGGVHVRLGLPGPRAGGPA